MNTYGLLNFEFVDRTRERNEIRKFLQSDNQYLWINGDLDTGKSFLATHFRWKDYNYTYIHTEVSGQSEYNLYKNIVFELNRKSTCKFKKFILSNYTGLFNLAKNTVSSSIEKLILKDRDFLKSLYSELVLLIDKEGQNKSTSKVLAQYINKISAEQPVVLIVDDVSSFDNTNFNLLKELIFETIGFKSFKIILITNQEDENTQINQFLTEKLPCDYMLIEPFDDKIFFAEIILSKFPNDSRMISYIPKIFDICKGYPEKLRNLFQSFLLNPQKAIRTSGPNITINYDYFDEYLINHTEINIREYSLLEQLILKLITPLSSPIDIGILINAAIFVGEKILSFTFEYVQIFNTINKLLDFQVLRKMSNTVAIFSDSLQKKILVKLQNTIPDSNMINHYVYLYLLSFKDDMEKISISSDQYFELLSLYAYLGKEELWISYNYEYGLKKADHGEISVASAIFDRLESHYLELEGSEILFIGECYYNNGEYIKTLNLLNLIKTASLPDEKLFKYYFILGKCNFIILNASEAAQCFSNAENTSKTLDEKIMAINMKIQSYREYTNGSINADTVYKSYFESYSHLIECNDLESLPKSLSGFLRNSLFFFSAEKATLLCEKAIRISEEHNDFINVAFAKNNYAYYLIKKNKIKDAMKCYNEACNILSNFRIHETAYCLNNIAVCNMLNGNYEEALCKLTEAALVSTSFYANYCIETHTMMCNLRLFRTQTALEIANNLYRKISNTKILDLTILRRVNMNLCIAYYVLGDNAKAIECLNNVKPISIGTLSELRTIHYDKLLNQNCCISNSSDVLHDATTDFEPWLIMFSHD